MIISIVRYEENKKKEWDVFIKKARNSHFMFLRDYMDYHKARFKDHSLMIYDDEKKLIAVLPANEDNDTLYSHQGLTFGGFIISPKMRTPTMLLIFTALKKYAAECHFKKIIYKAIPYFYHQQPASEDLYALFLHNAKLFRVDVSSTIHTKDSYPLSSSRKSGLKKAKDHLLEVETGSSKDIEDFIALLNGALEEKYNTQATHTADELSLLMSRFPENIKLYKCVHNDRMVTGVLTFEMKDIIHTQYIASNDHGKEIGAVDMVLHHIVERAKKEKTYFNFGTSTEKNGTYLNESLIFQKESFGARATVHQFFEMDIATAN